MTSNNYSDRSVSSHRRGSRRKKSSIVPSLVFAAAILFFGLIAYIYLNNRINKPESTDKTESQTESGSARGGLHNKGTLDLSILMPEGEKDTSKYSLKLEGKTEDDIFRHISSLYDWDLSIVNDAADVGTLIKPTVDADETTEAATMGDAEHPDGAGLNETAEETSPAVTVVRKIDVPDLIAGAAEDLIKEIFDNDASSDTGKNYVLSIPDADARVAAVVDKADEMWYKPAKGSSIGSYDAEKDEFIIEGEEAGFEIDRVRLAEDINDALKAHRYSEDIKVSGTVISPEKLSGVSEYTEIGTFTTRTTAIEVRNKNVRLACETLNGTILRPGEELSFNDTIGQRTVEKGYGAAAAYNNGEVVQEIGGGVCQVSSTLYNAVIKAGLKVTKRQSHTFKPSYVTPGMDATISWGGPDFRFANVPMIEEYSYDTSYAIGIRAKYKDRTVTVSIYGRPVLKPGYSYELQSRKLSDIPLVRVPIQPGEEREPTTGDTGSTWETRLIIRNGDEVISNDIDHKTYYSGHIEYFVETVPETDAEGLSDIPLPPAGPGEAGGQTGGSSSSYSVIKTTAAETEPHTTAAQPKNTESLSEPGGPGMPAGSSGESGGPSGGPSGGSSPGMISPGDPRAPSGSSFGPGSSSSSSASYGPGSAPVVR